MNKLFDLGIWSESLMAAYAKSMWLKVKARESYPNGIRGTYAREIDEADCDRIFIKPVARYQK